MITIPVLDFSFVTDLNKYSHAITTTMVWPGIAFCFCVEWGILVQPMFPKFGNSRFINLIILFSRINLCLFLTRQNPTESHNEFWTFSILSILSRCLWIKDPSRDVCLQWAQLQFGYFMFIIFLLVCQFFLTQYHIRHCNLIENQQTHASPKVGGAPWRYKFLVYNILNFFPSLFRLRLEGTTF